MENVQKMALVDPRLLKTLHDKAPTKSTPVESALSKLDADMNSIVNNTMPLDAKVKLYNETLQKYRFYSDVNAKRPPMEVTVVGAKKDASGSASSSTPVDRRTEMVQQIVAGMPKSLKHKAARIMRIVNESPGMDFKPTGQLVVEGDVIPNSNIEDLVHDVVRKTTKIGGPVGWERFMAALNEANVPKTLVGNKRRLPQVFQQPEPMTPPSVRSIKLPTRWISR
uniref:Serine--tRNA ligase, mitochondrial n=1 Tax=Phallusia mammillata TaxID=59560 RepID=A0A6F9DS87_9ASCI|nr:serine--tRNA ligase, mitochondrial [Phallusia mammillata]